MLLAISDFLRLSADFDQNTFGHELKFKFELILRSSFVFFQRAVACRLKYRFLFLLCPSYHYRLSRKLKRSNRCEYLWWSSGCDARKA